MNKAFEIAEWAWPVIWPVFRIGLLIHLLYLLTQRLGWDAAWIIATMILLARDEK